MTSHFCMLNAVLPFVHWSLLSLQNSNKNANFFVLRNGLKMVLYNWSQMHSLEKAHQAIDITVWIVSGKCRISALFYTSAGRGVAVLAKVWDLEMCTCLGPARSEEESVWLWNLAWCRCGMSNKELNPSEFKPQQQIGKLSQSSASRNVDVRRLLHTFKWDEHLSSMDESCPKY